MASLKSTRELLGAEIKDLFSAEKQLIKAIPKMIAGAKNEGLKAGLKAHLEETKGQAVRLESIAEMLEIKATGKMCAGMEGIIKEGAEAIATDGPADVSDLGIIAAARRVEHYEMAGYMSAIALAQGLRLAEVTAMLQATLEEEKGAEESLKRHMAGLVRTSLVTEADSGSPAAKRAARSLAGVV